jgi:hypothetical protein
MCILLCAEITCVSTRKTDNLHVELVSDVVAYSILDNNNNSEEEVDNNNSDDNGKQEETKPQMTAYLIEKIVKQYKSHMSAADFDARFINGIVDSMWVQG